MKLFQKRVIQEAEELRGKIKKLEKFIDGPIYANDLDPVDRLHLATQLVAMKKYDDVLTARIARFS